MTLKPIRQTQGMNYCFQGFRTSERGGILSITNVSGIDMMSYAINPSGVKPLGIQLNDIENINLSREYHPILRRTDEPFENVGVGTDGDFLTDWLHISGIINIGTPAYVGPSGTITNISSLGGVQIGHFLSQVKSDPHVVYFSGLGFSTAIMDPRTKKIVIENNPEDQQRVITPGYAKIRIKQNIISRSLREKGY